MHVHVPSGAIPKGRPLGRRDDGRRDGVGADGPIGSGRHRDDRRDHAVGRVLPIGGVKEKVLAARRVGIREVILPKQNAKNVNEDLTPELRQEMTVHLVSTIDEVLALALVPVSSDVPDVKKKKEEGKSDVRSGRGYSPPTPA